MNKDAHYKNCFDQMRRGQYQEAIKKLQDILSYDPEDGKAHSLLGLCLLSIKRFHAAEYEAYEGLRYDPDYCVSYYVLGVLRTQQQNHQEAETFFQESLARNPHHISSYSGLAQVYELTGQEEKILPLLDQALGFDPEGLEILMYKAAYFFRRKKTLKAKEIALYVLAINSLDVDALILMGEIYLKDNHLNEAKEHILLALNQDPQNIEALRLLCDIKFRQNPIHGILWRFSRWLGALGSTSSITFLISSFIVVSVAVGLSRDLGFPKVSQIIWFLWCGLCIYTWISPFLFQKLLSKELKTVKLIQYY